MAKQMKFKCFFDGACAPKNPYGHMGIGAVIQQLNPVTNEYENVWTHTDYRAEGRGNSNNVAEYMAVKAVLTELVNRGGLYAAVARETVELRRGFENIRFQWIPRELNTYADELSNVEFKKRNIKQFSN